jgi:hypothetical protein
MINGKIITSRTEHRELLKRHNCVEIGNDTAFLKPQPKPKSDKRKRVLASQMADLSDRQIKGLIKQEIKARRH